MSFAPIRCRFALVTTAATQEFVVAPNGRSERSRKRFLQNTEVDRVLTREFRGALRRLRCYGELDRQLLLGEIAYLGELIEIENGLAGVESRELGIDIR